MTETVLSFVGDLIASVAWPLTVIAIAVLFRQQVAAILDALHKRMSRLSKATGPGGTSFEFYEDLDEARSAHEILQTSASGDGDQVDHSGEADRDAPLFVNDAKRQRLVRESPAAALLVVYAELEEQVARLHSQLGMGTDSPRARPQKMLQDLVRAEIVPHAALDIFEPVRRARNLAAHGPVDKQDEAEVRELIDIAVDLARIMDVERTRRRELAPDGR